MKARYDTIGTTYARYRRPDPRVQQAIDDALGGATAVLDVGTGAGSYQPRTARAVGVDPSMTMLRQRPDDAPPAVLGVAEALPFGDGTFEAATAILTVHHWSDFRAGLAEVARVSRRQVVLCWDRRVYTRFWLLADYFPELPASEAAMPTADEVSSVVRVVASRVVSVPWDCTDGFCGAYWRRPEVYLDPDARAAISGFARAPSRVVDRVVGELSRDLEAGTWHERYASLLDLEELDLGYRLLIAEGLR